MTGSSNISAFSGALESVFSSRGLSEGQGTCSDGMGVASASTDAVFTVWGWEGSGSTLGSGRCGVSSTAVASASGLSCTASRGARGTEAVLVKPLAGEAGAGAGEAGGVGRGAGGCFLVGDAMDGGVMSAI